MPTSQHDPRSARVVNSSAITREQRRWPTHDEPTTRPCLRRPRDGDDNEHSVPTLSPAQRRRPSLTHVVAGPAPTCPHPCRPNNVEEDVPATALAHQDDGRSAHAATGPATTQRRRRQLAHNVAGPAPTRTTCSRPCRPSDVEDDVPTTVPTRLDDGRHAHSVTGPATAIGSSPTT